MMTKFDVVELALKLPALFYGFKLATLIVAFPISLIMKKGQMSLYSFIGVFIPFLVAVIMVWKSEVIIGWLFKNKNNSEPVN